MVDQPIIQKIWAVTIGAVTVALGIRDNDEDIPIKIIGGGCFINTKGYLPTAAHAIRNVELICKMRWIEGIEKSGSLCTGDLIIA